MEILKLVKKSKHRVDIRNLLVYDELIAGMLSREFFVPVLTGADKGIRIMPLSYLLDNFEFPAKDGRPDSRITDFLQGYPALYSKLSFYEQTPATA